MQLRLHGITYRAVGVVEFDLRDPAGGILPPASYGAHIDLHLENGLLRSYSLCNATHDTHRYVIAVGLHPESRGGSRFLHEKTRVGAMVTVAPPRNSFPLVEDAEHILLVAGGIGVTPFWAMAQRLTELGRSWEMVYAARSRQTAAYVDDLEALANRAGAKIRFHFSEIERGRVDLNAVLAQVDPKTHAYCCGPAEMIMAFREAAQGHLADDQVHVEFFKAAETPETSGEHFDIRLQQSGRVLRVGRDTTILDTLLEAGLDLPYSCMEGICGSCQVGVVDGIPDHRDAVLSSRERIANDIIIACCSRSKSEMLTLDL